ncbi:Threonine/homoserine/homoserine lactone efflux protein [Duganella sp. CF402]|uniref:LysE family translocator n=1 Tax=unclassified Duganella TaxID=2636909 RepID=UPI0008CE6C2E|nr:MULTISPECIES: LysE family translocator [unclassified Duganella]RZT06317.1 threonine/homoserine/homoserine lactone efflux protein [Duganella sp. BK701]SEM67864.1 Threonine/homoserine/homoserine lactone efflux protein [Duganella sp. CF402]
MFGIHDLTLFIISGLLLNIMPGPDNLLIMTRSAAQGWRAGSAAALGIGTGTMVHVLAAALGLSAVLSTSAAAFTVVKWVGAAYIVYMGIGMLRAKLRGEEVAEAPAVQPLAWRKIYLQGLLTNVLNPKVALFFLAFVPQFIHTDSSNKPLAFIILGAIFNFNGMLYCHGLALFTAFASARLNIKPLVSLWLNRTMGGLFLALGVRLALSEQN